MSNYENIPFALEDLNDKVSLIKMKNIQTKIKLDRIKHDFED